MAVEHKLNEITRKAGADLTSKEHFAVKFDANGDVILAAAATDKILGVLTREVGASAEPVGIAVEGLLKGVAGGTIAAGDFLTSDANGKLVATTTAGDIVIGQATESAVANDVFEFITTKFKY